MKRRMLLGVDPGSEHHQFTALDENERIVLVQTLAHSLAALGDTLKQLESQLENQLLQHPFGKWLLDQEGIGVRTAGCFPGEASNLAASKTKPNSPFAPAMVRLATRVVNLHKSTVTVVATIIISSTSP
jgi:hypothetical protein